MSSSTAFIIAVFLAIADRNALDARAGLGRSASPASRSSPPTSARSRTAPRTAISPAIAASARTAAARTTPRSSAPCRGTSSATASVRCSARPSVPLGDRVFVIGASGITASKAGEHRERYNQAVEALQALLALWRDADRRDAGDARRAARRGTGDGRSGCAPSSTRRRPGPVSAEVLRNRLDHFVAEAQRLVPGATRALAAGDFAAFGALVDESQHLAERWLGNQIAETSALARLARRLGAEGASAFGAGFGGSVWALVPEREAEKLLPRRGAPPTKPSSRCSPAAPRSSAPTPARPSCGSSRPDGSRCATGAASDGLPPAEKRGRNCTTATGRFVDNGPGGPGQLSMALKTIDVTRTTTPRPRPDEAQLGFGKYFADHMLLVEYGPQGWSEPRIVPYGPLALDPAASVLHYGQAMFEGLKAFRHANGRVALFRVDDNLKRLASGAPRLSMPVPDVAMLQGGDGRARRRRQGLGAVAAGHRALPAPDLHRHRRLPRRPPGDALPALRDHLAGRRLLRVRLEAGEDLGRDRGGARRPRRHRLGQGRGQLRRQHEGRRRRPLARLRAGAVARRASSAATSRKSAR